MTSRNTTKLLAKLRSLMNDVNILNGKPQLKAYIIPSSDAHGSEYLNPKDKRREFISGFSGSSGTAVVSDEKALLWTDGRYFLQASQELDSNWTLMKDGLPETPSLSDWLITNLPQSSTVGIDATLYEEDLFISLATKLNSNKIQLIHIEKNLIDLVSQEEGAEKFAESNQPLIKLNIEHVGKKTSEKLAILREQMEKLNVDSLVITSLDEISWILNMRGADIPYGTAFFAYCIITLTGCKLFTNQQRLNEGSPNLKDYLLSEEKNFEFFEYEEFYEYFKKFVHTEYVSTFEQKKKKIFLSSSSNHAIHSMVPNEMIHKDLSLITKLKIIKNSNEIESAKRIHLRDSACLIEFLYQVIKKFEPNGEEHFSNIQLDEYTLGNYLDNFRAKQDGFLRPSFETICGFGPNGAIIHYKAKKESAKKIEANNILLIDSGGHYRDMGTTDVTRTVYLGDKSKITAYQKECFTRVLKGHIQLSSKIFPLNTRSELMDSFARQALWEVGLDYRHGTGHGVGALLNVHEVPIITYKKSIDMGLQENMIVTIEPGYYEDGKFGIRIENCVVCEKATTKYKFYDVNFLRFEPLTLVPIQQDLIDKSILNQHEINWLNEYHERCLRLVGDELKKQNKIDIYNWLVEQTRPL